MVWYVGEVAQHAAIARAVAAEEREQQQMERAQRAEGMYERPQGQVKEQESRVEEQQLRNAEFITMLREACALRAGVEELAVRAGRVDVALGEEARTEADGGGAAFAPTPANTENYVINLIDCPNYTFM